jgi:hypothetical protein
MHLQKVISKKPFVGFLKVTDENSRIRSRIRIRLLEILIRDPNPYQKCHGSATLPNTVGKANSYF